MSKIPDRIGVLKLKRRKRAQTPCPVTNNFGMVRQEKAHDAEGESPSRQNMHDYTKT
jgi:hypothetical protein